jgi:hypothetical protein
MSTFNSLNVRDFAKGVMMAVLTPVVGYVYQILSAGTFTFDWSYLGKLALSGFVGYLVKNYFTDSSGKVLGKI